MEIERIFSVIEETESKIKTNKKLADLLRQSILRAAFGGMLVSQNPNDEPASILLERIKAEREKVSKRSNKGIMRGKGKVLANKR